jgi:Tfp pilus assembly protein PilV
MVALKSMELDRLSHRIPKSLNRPSAHKDALRFLNERGTTIIEVIVATVIIVIVVISASLTIPRASKSQLVVRQRNVAVGLAASKIEELKKQTYARIPVSDPSPSLSTTCECTKANFDVWPATWSYQAQAAGTTFELRWCVNQTQSIAPGAWASDCYAETGNKHIVVEVNWQTGGRTRDEDRHRHRQESIVSRY